MKFIKSRLQKIIFFFVIVAAVLFVGMKIYFNIPSDVPSWEFEAHREAGRRFNDENSTYFDQHGKNIPDEIKDQRLSELYGEELIKHEVAKKKKNQ